MNELVKTLKKHKDSCLHFQLDNDAWWVYKNKLDEDPLISHNDLGVPDDGPYGLTLLIALCDVHGITVERY